jgi:hypothetical protein
MDERHEQAMTITEQPEMKILHCPRCHTRLLAYRATNDLQIEIKCHDCSEAKNRGVYITFVINYQRPAQQPK